MTVPCPQFEPFSLDVSVCDTCTSMTDVERCQPIVSRNVQPFGDDWRWDCPQCDKGRVVGTHSDTKCAARQHAKQSTQNRKNRAAYVLPSWL